MFTLFQHLFYRFSLNAYSELGLNAMRLGPGKHLKGLTLMNGLVKPEEFDYFHEVGQYFNFYYLSLHTLHTLHTYLRAPTPLPVYLTFYVELRLIGKKPVNFWPLQKQ
jgi:hypothetical protein